MDLGVDISFDLQPKKHCITTKSCTNRVLDLIYQNVNNHSVKFILKLYIWLWQGLT